MTARNVTSQPETNGRDAAYIRVSTDRQVSEGFSLPEQERRSAARSEQDGRELVEIYCDAAFSGRRDDRPDLQRLLADARAGRFDRVIVFKLDRLGRNARHLLAVYDELEKLGVPVVSLSDNIDTSTPGGKVVRTVLSAFAEFESDTIGERTRAGKQASARAGRRNGGPRPYGFTQSGGILERVAHEVEILLRIAREYVAGRTQSQIARDLNRDGIVTTRGKAWNQAQVSAHLRNPIYRGFVKNNGELHRAKDGSGHEVEPIFRLDLSEQVDRLLNENARRSKGRGRQPKRHLLIGGLGRCACGASLRPRSDPKGYGSYDVYICDGRHSGASPDCTQKAVARADLDTAVYRFFEQVGLDVEATRAQIAEERDRELAEVRALREHAELEALRKQDALAKIERDYLERDLGAASYERLSARLTEEQAAASAEAAQLAERERQVRETTDRLDAEQEALRRLTEVRRQVVGRIREAGLLDARGHRHPLWRENPPADLIAGVRAALVQVFDAFILHHDPLGEIEPDPNKPWFGKRGEYVIEPKLRDDAVPVALNHAEDKYTFATMNLCPCGGRGDARAECSCSPQRLAAFRDKLSRALLDRFDLVVTAPRPRADELAAAPAESSAAVRERVVAARERLRQSPLRRTGEADELLARAVDRLPLSGRGRARVARVARTAAALAGADAVLPEHVAEALSYRSPRELEVR